LIAPVLNTTRYNSIELSQRISNLGICALLFHNKWPERVSFEKPGPLKKKKQKNKKKTERGKKEKSHGSIGAR
jgi:hypothetical protein